MTTRRVRQRFVLALAGCAVTAACSTDVAGSSTTAPPTVAATTTSSSSSTSSTSSTIAPATSTTSSTSTTTSSTTSTSTSTSTTSTSTTSTTTTTPAPGVAADGLPLATLPAQLPAASNPSIWQVRPPSDIPAPPIPAGWDVQWLGFSHFGRQIEVWSSTPATATTNVVVVGGIHGNEPVSPPIVRSLVDVDYPDHVAIWLVPVLNPDGSISGTRSNALGVDLNRNFGWNWWPSDGGGEPFSQPETEAVAGLIDEVDPDLVVWVHQPLGYVSSIGTTPDAYEQAWSRGSGVPVRPDVTQHGGGESWTNLTLGIDSMLIEVDGWNATPEMVAAHRNGFIELLAVL